MNESERRNWIKLSLAVTMLWAVCPETSQAATGEHARTAAEGAEADGHTSQAGSEAPNPLKVDPDLALWTAGVFGLTLLVLGKFAWRPIIEALDRRERAVAGHIEAAEGKHEEAKQQLIKYEQKLASAADEVREMLEEARRDAEHTKQEIIGEAKTAAQAEHERALRDVRNAKEAALKEIGESGAAFAVELAGKIVRKELSEEDHSTMIRDAVAQFPSSN